MKVITEPDCKPIKSWCENPEPTAIQQALNLARLPFLFRHVALMPDTHQGYGMPIGGVIATNGVVIPNAVGVDIGCGMCAAQTTLTEIPPVEKLKEIIGQIRKAVPVGFAHHQQGQDGMPVSASKLKIVDEQYKSAEKQLGTLGGGNHFIELQFGNDGRVWAMIHSGSRNLGKQVADHYNKLAKELNEKWHTRVPKEHDLAFFPIDTAEGQAYLKEMDFCLDFALANRQLMMNRIKEIMGSITGCAFVRDINIHHNYAAMENHFGQNLMVHRKGATAARIDQLGLIPGSQGSSSYVVVGKGNEESFQSCSHGAGRRMGRKEAQRVLNIDAEVARLNAMGVIHAIRNAGDLDEAPGAYKDIETVMGEQVDLVDIAVKLTPLAVIKA
jgi:tRNA-splicing ligase RtcB